jgi:hypothetical protein
MCFHSLINCVALFSVSRHIYSLYQRQKREKYLYYVIFFANNVPIVYNILKGKSTYASQHCEHWLKILCSLIQYLRPLNTPGVPSINWAWSVHMPLILVRFECCIHTQVSMQLTSPKTSIFTLSSSKHQIRHCIEHARQWLPAQKGYVTIERSVYLSRSVYMRCKNYRWCHVREEGLDCTAE